MNFWECISTPIFFDHDITSHAIKRISSFGNLQDGWYYGAGVAPKKETIYGALSIAAVMENAGFNVEAFPDECGEILVSGKLRNQTVDVTIDNRICTIVKKRNDVEIECSENVALNGVIQKLTNQPLPCNIHAFFIPYGGAIEISDLATSHSSRRAKNLGEGSRLSKFRAPRHRRELSARISTDITPRDSTYQFYFGDSTEPYFLTTH